MTLIFIIYLFTVILYFFTLRKILSKDADLDIDNMNKVFLIIILGLIPIINVLYVISMIVEYLIYCEKLEPNDILKKILFIKGERDERWR